MPVAAAEIILLSPWTVLELLEFESVRMTGCHLPENIDRGLYIRFDTLPSRRAWILSSLRFGCNIKDIKPRQRSTLGQIG